MAAKPRTRSRRDWPDGLRERRSGYFSWVNPETGVEIGIGRVPLADARQQAIEANLVIQQRRPAARLVDRVNNTAGRAVDELCNRYKEALERLAKPLSVNTMKSKESCIRATREHLGALIVARVEVSDISDMIDLWATQDKLRMALLLHSFLKELFLFAESIGWIPRGSNPVAPVKRPEPMVQRSRLSLDQFKLIYSLAEEPWEKRMMELALVSAQGRNELCDGYFNRPKDEEGMWVEAGMLWVHRKKTGVKLRIPLSLTLPELGLSLEEIVRRCRDNIVSRHLLHHSRTRTLSKPGDQIAIDTLSKGFARARDKAGIDWGDKQPATLHEIRSLALRLYGDRFGAEFAQALVGHKDPRTTAVYRDARGSEWREVKVA